jgi:tRNA(Ile)-lysidine synthase
MQAEQIANAVLRHSGSRPLWLAYSGGIDSLVLVDLLHKAQQQLHFQLRLVHVNHQLSAESNNWAQHCLKQAQHYHLPIDVLTVTVDKQSELGLEAAAREARYQAIAEHIEENAVLITAQHQQDQAETLLLQLLRGAGPKGLAAMSPSSKVYGIEVLRPLLNVSQSAINDYAQQHQLNWVEDPSNDDISIRRNYLRQQIWPLLEAEWPAASQTLARSAAHCAESHQLNIELAELDCQRLAINPTEHRLSIDALLTLSAARQRNLLRYVLERLDIPSPSSVVLQRIIDELCLAKADKQPEVSWAGGEARRYQQQLYLMTSLEQPEPGYQFAINSTDTVELGAGWLLQWQPKLGEGISLECIEAGLSVACRQGGEKIRLAGHAHSKTLKQLMQDWKILPWQRPIWPLILQAEQLIAVSDYGVAESLVVAKQEIGYLPIVKRSVSASF